MEWTERLRAWGLAHAQARSAESAARRGGPTEDAVDLRRQAQVLRDQADRLHREIYCSFDRPRDEPGR